MPTPGNTSRPGLSSNVWSLLRPYWSSEERRSALVLLAAIVILTLGLVFINVQLNEWYKDFYNTLQEHNEHLFFVQLGKWGVLAGLYISMSVYAVYLNQWLQIRWRRWLTENYLTLWLADTTYYRMHVTGAGVDNPDQRIAEDLRLFVQQTLDLGLGMLEATVSLISFIGILWALSGPITIPLWSGEASLPGYMVWVAIVYALCGSWLTHRIGRALITLNFNQQRYEADFRFSLARFRENCEGVALYHGEEDEHRGFRERFARLFRNWWALMKRRKTLNFFTVGYNVAANVFPIAVAAPRYFSGAIQLGGLMQIANAFGQVQSALSWFVNAYPVFAEWKASVDRLTSFRLAIEEAGAGADRGSGIRVVPGGGDALELDGLELTLPDGTDLVAAPALAVPRGVRVLLRGPSGSGKSTLLRAVAGIWPFGHGTVRRPPAFRALFLPQRPYFPLGTLRVAVCYPAPATAFSDEALGQALEAVGLGALATRLDEVADWGTRLSGGEQQRVAFARALVNRPDWLFLDEATSNLDVDAERSLYETLIAQLPRSTIVSVAHREGPARYHGRTLTVDQRRDGTRVLRAA